MLRHSWNISPAEAVALQRRLAQRVAVTPLTDSVLTVAGADCAFVDARGRTGRAAWGAKSGVRIVAASVLCDAKTMEVIATREVLRPCRFPYVPGLLSFREAPTVIEAVRRLPLRPDLLMCDGQGIAHPRRLGLASHVGLALDLPTIGVAKSLLIGKHRPVGRARRCRVQLRDGGEVIGSVVRTRDGVKPLYVSIGHRITLAEAIRWTLNCCRGVRLPEPARQAHRLVSAAAQAMRR